MSIAEKDKSFVMNTYARFPVTLVRGEGSYAYDDTGKKYIDFSSGIAVNSFGYCDSEWLAAVTKQAGTLQHTSNLYYTEPCVKLAELLCNKTGMSKVFFSNSGAEANECAIKAARRYALLTKGDGHSNIITLKNSFHGRTVTTLSATGQEHYHTDFNPFTEGFLYADTNSTLALEEYAAAENCAAIMLETIQGEGGVLELSEEFLECVAATSKKYDIPVIVDEVQTGNGRTGKLFSYMHTVLRPDIVTTAKGLGGGLPIGATLFSKRFSDSLTAGTHGSTFGGNPVVCAGALSILERLDEKFLSDVTIKGLYIKNMLLKTPGVKSVSGKGLMLGVELTKNAAQTAVLCRENGVLVLTAKDKLRLLPPLNISREDLIAGTQLICNAIAE